MKIGIDARFLTHPQMGGFKTYTENLIRALLEVDDTNQYVLYVDRPGESGALPVASNVEYRIVKGSVPGIEMPVREQFALRRAMDRDRLDLVHFLCNTAPVAIDTPYVLTLHDTVQVTSENPFRITPNLSTQKAWAITAYSKWTILRTAHAAARIITVSNYEREKIAAELSIPRDRICVTHLAPNKLYRPGSTEERAAWRQELGHTLGLPDHYLMGIGYEPRKNIPLLIKTFTQIAPLHADLHLLVIAAQEQRRQEFQEMAANTGLNGKAIILGSQPSSVLMKLYNLAELFVYPSERESFGLPPLEAMACGTPTVAMRESALPEILDQGALLVDGGDVRVWAEQITEIIGDRAQLARLTEHGLRRAAQLTWQHCARKTMDMYYAALGQNAPTL